MKDNITTFGSYPSEEKRNKYFYIVLMREDMAISAKAVIYPHSVYLSDVETHTFREENDGEKCDYSPTGFCGAYAHIRWSSSDAHFSPRIVAEILIERLNKLEDFRLTSLEIMDIRNSIKHEIDLFEE